MLGKICKYVLMAGGLFTFLLSASFPTLSAGAEELGPVPSIEVNQARADLGKISHDAELAVCKKLAEWPRLVEIAARTHEPHRVAFYLYELASELHALWNKGNEVTELRFLQDGDAETSQSKIALARSVAVVISSGLGILGVTPAQEMR